LFASGDSNHGKLESVYPRGLREARIKDLYGLTFDATQHWGLPMTSSEFDIIHDHMAPFRSLRQTSRQRPVVAPCTGALMPKIEVIPNTAQCKYRNYLEPRKFIPRQRSTMPVRCTTVLHGPLSFGNDPEDYLLYVGRITMEKGTHVAIEWHSKLDRKLIIAGKSWIKMDQRISEYVEPRLSDRVQWNRGGERR